MKINKSEINRIKEDLEKEISQRNYTSLRYVLFNKNSKLSHATHLYYENNKYYIENRDERGELIGNPYTFEDSSKAKKCFFEVLGEVVALNSYYNNTFGEVPYDSPLWSKSSNDDNKIIKEQYEVFHPEKTKNESPIWLRDDVNITLVSPKLGSRGIVVRGEVFHPEKTKNESPIWLRDDVNNTLVSPKLGSGGIVVRGEVFHPEKTKDESPIWLRDDVNNTLVSPKLGSGGIVVRGEVFHPEKTKDESPIWLRDDVNITLVSSKLESRDRYKISTLKDNVSGNEVVCKGNKKHFYYPCLKSKPVKVRVPKGILKKGVGSYTFTTSQHL